VARVEAGQPEQGQVLPLPLPPAAVPPPATTVGRIVGWSDEGLPLVDYPHNAFGPRPARILGELSRPTLEHAEAAQREVLLILADGDPPQPYIMNVVQPPPGADGSLPGPVVERDGDRVVIEGEREVVLQCGEAKLVLRRDGKIIIHGRDVTTRARRRHRIKGGAVLIN
jgi:hypothetical protein